MKTFISLKKSITNEIHWKCRWHDKDFLENLRELVYVLYILIVVQTKQKRDS